MTRDDSTLLKKHQKAIRNRLFNESVILVVSFLNAWAIAYAFDLFDQIYSFLQAHEHWELDELFMAAIILCILLGLFAVLRVRDISKELTRRVKAEELLAKEKSKWHSVVETSPDNIILLDTEARIQYLNRPIMDSTLDLLKGAELASLLSSSDAATLKLALLKAQETAQPVKHLYSYPSSEGGTLYFEAMIVPRYENKKLEGYSVTARNITDRKRAEEELRSHRDHLDELVTARTSELTIANLQLQKEILDRKKIQTEMEKSEARYRELFDTLHEGVGLMSPEGEILFCNPAYANIFEEESTEKMIGKNLSEYLAEDQTEKIQNEIKKRSKGISSVYEIDIISRMGNRKSLLISASPKFDGMKFIGSYGAVSDLSEIKRLQELTQRAQRLETAGRIAGQVAHDFNNLLGPIVAYPELIKSKLEPNHPILKYLKDFEQSALQIAEINSQLLALGRRGHYNQKVFNLNEIVENCVSQLQEVPDNISIEVVKDPELLNVFGGASQTSRVIFNLIVNAIDASSNGGKITVSTNNCYLDETSGLFGTVPKGEYVKVAVTDKGDGIPHDVLPRILDPFYSTKNTDSKRGSGLGLSVVNSVMQDHSGYLDIETIEGKGTSFFLYFPSSREEQQEEKPVDIRGGNESILIVDDDIIQRDLNMRLLSNLGYNIMTAESGEDALEIVQEVKPDLIILDMIMPDGIDGAQTYLRMLDIVPNQRTILISGYAESERVKLALKAGAGAFVKKPITLSSLASAVRTELDRPIEKQLSI